MIPDHESPLRRMMADASGESYSALQSLDEAKGAAAVVVMEGDYGGSIYLTCPAQIVECDETTLRQLALDIDERDWNDPDGLGLFYERVEVGEGVAGGRGGGTVTDGIWLHPDLETKGLREAIQAVLSGRQARL